MGLGTVGSPVLCPKPTVNALDLPHAIVSLSPCLDMDVTQQQSWAQDLEHRDRGRQWLQSGCQGKVTQKNTQAARTGQGLIQAEIFPVA